MCSGSNLVPQRRAFTFFSITINFLLFVLLIH